MASIDENRRAWGDSSRWESDGDEWSVAWGSTHAMWFGTILPRIAAFLPAGHLLEIAPGHGRVTRFLLDHCKRYTGIDVAPECVEHCERRFAAVPHAWFFANDGRSLGAAADDSVDFAFSWDSLVHADRNAVGSYVRELARALTPGGAAFLHHSNLGALPELAADASIRERFWRDPTVSAETVRASCRAAGVTCASQELIQWGSPHLTDCLTVLRRPAANESPRDEPALRSHPDMTAEMSNLRELARLYGRRDT